MKSLATDLGDQPVLIASADQFVSAIAKHAEALAPHYRLSPGLQLQGALATKESQYDLAERYGMPMPRSRMVATTEEASRFAAAASYPCLVKPLHFREWQNLPDEHPLADRKVAIATTADALLRLWALVEQLGSPAILQEIIPGPDTAKRVYVACYGADGRKLGSAVFRELRCDPMGFGPATVSEPVDDPEAAALGDGWLERMGYSGPCEIEMKWDQGDKKLKLIEANPRLTGGGDAAPYAGVDVCWLHYLDMTGYPVVPVRSAGRDFRHIALRSDLGAIVSYRRAGLLSWKEVLRSYRGPRAFYDLDRADWKYSLETIYRAVRTGVGELLRPMLRRRTASSEATALLREWT
jgi:predicted ATP-grasp superfamily ATP-dependent carboligase